MDNQFTSTSYFGESASSDPSTEIRGRHIRTKQPYSFWDVLRRFADKTSCVGPGNISTSRSWHGRVMWILLFLSAWSLTIYMTHKNFIEYTSFKTRVGVYMGFSKLKFPMVSICNTNPIRRSQINYTVSSELRDFLVRLDYTPSSNSNDSNFEWSHHFWDSNETDYFSEYYYYDDYDWGPIVKADPRSQVTKEFKILYGGEDSANKGAIGHQIEDMLISCSYAGLKCGQEHFVVTRSNVFGNCFTFNSEVDSNLTSRRSGNENGLSLILYLENAEYIPGLTSGYGARLVVGQPGQMVLPEYNGLYLSAGAETDVGLTLVIVEGGTFLSPMVYLLISLIFRSTLLVKEHHMEIVSVTLKTEVPSADFHRTIDTPAREQTYDMMLSSRDWPTNSYVNSLQETICKDPSQEADCNDLTYSDMAEKRRNFLKVNIFYRDMNYEDIKEEPSYSDSQFYSDLGGTAGLFLGLSVLSLFELAQLIMEVCEWSLERLCGHDPKEVQKPQQQENKSQNLRNINSVLSMDTDKMNGYREPIRYVTGQRT
ncbi:acid-sensing ion channel 4-B-like [Liolophura sinensis]|uniref:acid-sensing ion channel 4-B-like n=1 Tax=Liolophura sinensis TaxID=3198878 RepID=UPI00315814A3